MKATTGIGMLCLALLPLASIALSRAGAQGVARGGLYRLDSWAVSPGGLAQGGPYTLESAAGLPDIGAGRSEKYALSGGYWGGERVPVRSSAYLPVTVRR